jgi:hypothetical protein
MTKMENDSNKNKTKKVILFSLGTLALGGLTFLGIKLLTKSKNKTNDDNLKENNELDNKSSNQNNADALLHSAVPAVYVAPSFPLKLGAKGDSILQLQRALIKSDGAGILKKFGADGQFGSELATALRNKGYQIPLLESDFKKITQEKKEVIPNETTTLLTFNPTAIAKAIYDAIVVKDYSASITLLKGIKNTTDYSLVSEQLKTFRINGVRQNLVNAMLNTYTESSQKLAIQQVFKSMGLKYDGNKWSL